MQLPISGNNPYGVAPVIEPMSTNTLYFTTESEGTYVSKDSGGTWTEFTEVPIKANQRLTFDYNDNAMYVVSHGGGVFKRAIPQKISKETTVLNIKGYPNPCRINSAVNKQFKIINLPADSVVEIYSNEGVLIKRLLTTDFGNSGWVGWDGKNTNGEGVPSGMYMYAAVTSFGNKTGKIGIIR